MTDKKSSDATEKLHTDRLKRRKLGFKAVTFIQLGRPKAQFTFMSLLFTFNYRELTIKLNQLLLAHFRVQITYGHQTCSFRAKIMLVIY